MNLALELSEIEKQVSTLISENTEYKKQLTKAKLIIKDLLADNTDWTHKLEAEQFLKEIEK